MKVDCQVIVESEFCYSTYLTDRDGARLLHQLLHQNFKVTIRSTFGAELDPMTVRPIQKLVVADQQPATGRNAMSQLCPECGRSNSGYCECGAVIMVNVSPSNPPTTRLTAEGARLSAKDKERLKLDAVNAYSRAVAINRFIPVHSTTILALLAELAAVTAALNLASEEMADLCAGLEGEAADYWLERWQTRAAALGGNP